MKELREIVRSALTVRWEGIIPIRAEYDRGRALVERLWLKPPFQIERVTLAPNTKIGQHRHPHVDSWEIYLAGDGEARIGSRVFKIDSNPQCPALFIPHGIWHGGEVGTAGGKWLSVQQWLCAPASLSSDWEEKEDVQCLG